MEIIETDYDYATTLGLEVIAGRTFSPDYATDDSLGVLLTESAARMLDLGTDPVGQRISMPHQDDLMVVGVSSGDVAIPAGFKEKK